MKYSLNNSSKNPTVEHGSCVYLKGLAQQKPEYSSIAKAYETALEVSKDAGIIPMVVYEYFPLGKVFSLPDTAAFRRDSTPSVLIALFWKENTEANTERARALSHQLARIVTGAHPELTQTQKQGYSNYGACPSSLSLRMMK